jgi:hypothetical protein
VRPGRPCPRLCHPSTTPAEPVVPQKEGRVRELQGGLGVVNRPHWLVSWDSRSRTRASTSGRAPPRRAGRRPARGRSSAQGAPTPGQGPSRVPGSPPLVDRRRSTWERQRRLLAPLTIGRPPPPARQGTPRGRGGRPDQQPGTRGRHRRAAGQPRPRHRPGPRRLRARRLRPLPTRRGAGRPGHRPGLAPLFARAVAVVTDGGTLAAHASLVAREYGIPAVVATGDATTRLADGQVVTVDGSAGTISTAS